MSSPFSSSPSSFVADTRAGDKKAAVASAAAAAIATAAGAAGGEGELADQQQQKQQRQRMQMEGFLTPSRVALPSPTLPACGAGDAVGLAGSENESNRAAAAAGGRKEKASLALMVPTVAAAAGGAGVEGNVQVRAGGCCRACRVCFPLHLGCVDCGGCGGRGDSVRVSLCLCFLHVFVSLR